MITRKDVAQRAGVSVTAVSRVVNNNGYVLKEKRDAILKAIAELGYRPKSIQIPEHRIDTKQILFLDKDISNPFTMELYYGMADYAWQRGYMVSLNGTWEPDKIKQLTVSGVIISDEGSANILDSTFHDILPVPAVSASYGVAMGRPKHIPYIECDTYHAMEILIDYLQKRGHKNIAFASPDSINTYNPRGVAYKSMMLPILKEKLNDYIFITTGDVKSSESRTCDYMSIGKILADKIYERRSSITAVVCFNDSVALGLMLQFQRLGVRVPDDISIISMDGLDLIRYYFPQLTTVVLPARKIGSECARVLINMIENIKVPKITNINVGPIIEGNSVADLTRK